MKNNKIPHCQDSSTSMKNNKILHCQNSSNRKTTKYQTVRTVPIKKQQNTTLSEQFQNLIEKQKIPQAVGKVPKSNRKTKNTTSCRNSSKI
jgi:hypothetical protein